MCTFHGICMHVCTNVCMYVQMYACMYKCMHVCTNACVSMCVCTYMNLCRHHTVIIHNNTFSMENCVLCFVHNKTLCNQLTMRKCTWQLRCIRPHNGTHYRQIT